MLFVRRIRNGWESRHWSESRDRVGLLRHFLWWFGRPRRGEAVYVVWIEGNRSGYVRVKVTDSGFADLSVALDRDARGKGAGSQAIRESMRATSGLPGLQGWRAQIHEGNSSSIRAFSAAGFHRIVMDNNDTAPYLTFKRDNS